MDKKLEFLITQLEKKYQLTGQDMTAYVEGLLYSDYVPYWDYIHLDTLLTLQKPITHFPDEMIFIMYHQVTELYFKMILHEIRQIANRPVDKVFFIERMSRINRYFTILVDSFNVMTEGMEHKQFVQFRMALLPASGFQSVQYRKIEICCTDLINLVDKKQRQKFDIHSSLEEMLLHTYWRAGATELETGEKTLTLKQFEEKYDFELLKLANKYVVKNIWQKYLSFSEEDKNDNEIITQLRNLDTNVNVNWPLAHYRTAVRYLSKDGKDVPATGGTNWQKYLPARYQKRVFFPTLWSEKELEDWGKSWVLNAIKPYQHKP
ncbi:MAG: tryptophan 2,3-dioxygenase family protein [Bacteroidia bacterium]